MHFKTLSKTFDACNCATVALELIDWSEYFSTLLFPKFLKKICFNNAYFLYTVYNRLSGIRFDFDSTRAFIRFRKL